MQHHRRRARMIASIVAVGVLLLTACAVETESGLPPGNDAPPTATPTAGTPTADAPTPDTATVPEATATPIPPAPTSPPTPAPTTTSVELDLDQFIASAQQALADADEVTIETEIDEQAGQDLGVRSVRRIDRTRGLSAVELTFSGPGWNYSTDHGINEGRRTFIFDGDGRVLTRVEPAPTPVDEGRPWNAYSPALATQAVPAFGMLPAIDVEQLHAFLEVDAEVHRSWTLTQGEDTVVRFDLLVPNTEAVDLLPGRWRAIASAIDDPSTLEGITRLRLDFIDDELRSVRLRPRELLEALAAADDALGRNLFGLDVQVSVSYEASAIDVPADATITEFDSPTDPNPPLRTVGTCFASRDFELVSDPLVVDCAEPHFGEVFHVALHDAGFDEPYPGERAFSARGATFCAEPFHQVTGGHLDTTVHDIRIWYPSPATWAAFDREMVCVVRFDEPSSIPLQSIDTLRNSSVVSTYGLRAGDCLDEPLAQAFFRLMDCSQPHRYEVIHSERLPSGVYPGDADLQRRADRVCLERFEAVTGESYASSDLLLDRLVPNEDTWNRLSDRVISCVVSGGGAGSELRGSLVAPDAPGPSDGAVDAGQPGAGRTVVMGRANWASGYVQAQIVHDLLEALGYDVTNPNAFERAPDRAYEAIAEGEMHLWTNSWYPGHLSWWEGTRDDGEPLADHLVRVEGSLMPGGGMQGMLITKAWAESEGVTTLDQINADEALWRQLDHDGDGKAEIFGCASAWTCDDIIDDQIAFAGWNNFEQLIGDYDTQFEDFLDHVEAGEPAIIYTWTPTTYIVEGGLGSKTMWLSVNTGSVLDDSGTRVDFSQRRGDGTIGFTEVGPDMCLIGPDGCQLGWLAADIEITANREWLDDNPAALALFEAIDFSVFEISEATARANATGGHQEAVERAAADWIAAHRDRVDGWLELARSEQLGS